MASQMNINKYYRQGLDLLKSVAGFKDLIEHKRDYFIIGENKQRLPEPTDAYRLYKTGLDYMSRDDFREAVLCFRQAHAIMPNNPNYVFALATAQYQCGDYKKAGSSIAKLSRIDPQYSVRNASVQTISQNICAMAENVTQVLDKKLVVGESTFEVIDLVESVLRADGRFTMFELGAGWGRWISMANARIRFLRLPLATYFTAVEAEPTHYEFLLEHLAYNNISCNTIMGAMSDGEGIERFRVGNPLTHYGQCLVGSEWNKGPTIEVRTYSLDALLSEVGYVDLIDMDIQHAEGKVVTSSEYLPEKVRKVHIGTHGRAIEEMLRLRFDELNWLNVWDYPCGGKRDTVFGTVEFRDGIQCWINPKFF